MTVAEQLEDTPAKPVLRLLRGGKGPPSDSTPVADWLSPMEVGTVFTCRKKGQAENFSLMLLQVIFKHAKSIVIADSLNSNPYAIVDPVEFSKRHELFETISEGEPNNGHDLRTVRPPGVAHDADAEGGQPSDGSTGSE